MNHFEAFSCLGIPVTKDAAAIKSAYHKQLPLHHPEENPQGFMRLHQAYKAALAYAGGACPKTGFSAEHFRWPENTRSSREETGYDSLFAGLEENQAADLSRQKQDFFRKVRKLRLHWLPIPLKTWQRFFSSEVYLICRGDQECMEALFGLLVKKIHSYGVFRLLMNRLWELDGWQKSEGQEALAGKTRSCIAELRKQYSHYLKPAPSVLPARLLPALWYYQALPFFFKVLASTILFPVIFCGSGESIVLLLMGFYILELCIFARKKKRNLGLFHPTVQQKNRFPHFNSTGDNGFLVVVVIYTVLIHIGACLLLQERIAEIIGIL